MKDSMKRGIQNEESGMVRDPGKALGEILARIGV